MLNLHFGVIVFPGSNCDDDLMHVLQKVCKVKATKIWHKDSMLPELDGVFLPGGFSYGDYLRSGAIARYANIMPAVTDFAARGGFVMGICNGFQILCEAGLLPGALLANRDQKFICDNIYLKTVSSDSWITSAIPAGTVLKLPIAHADGRYYADASTLDELVAHDQILFKYCDPAGVVNEAGNINGSMMNIAGICNRERNVYGMMPHPERASESILGNRDGWGLFQSLIQNLVLQTQPNLS